MTQGAAKPYYRPRLQNWQRVSGYNAREIIKTGSSTVLTHYSIPNAPKLYGKKIIFFSDLHWDRSANIYRSFIEDINNSSIEKVNARLSG